jgi:hypothetical protein
VSEDAEAKLLIIGGLNWQSWALPPNPTVLEPRGMLGLAKLTASERAFFMGPIPLTLMGGRGA